MSIAEIEHTIAPQCSVDLVTIAQAMHWFDLPTFYQQVKRILKKPNGVIAAWCYTAPEVDPLIDSVFGRFNFVHCNPYFEQELDLVDLKYTTIDGVNHTGSFEFKTEKLMNLDGYFTYLRSWSAYQTAKGKGVESLTEVVLEDFKVAWNADGKSHKIVTFPVYLRISKLGLSY